MARKATWTLLGAGLALALIMGVAVFGVVGRRSERQRTAARQEGRLVPILMYHNVAADAHDDVWTVDAEAFRRQMNALRALGYETILPRELALATRGLFALPPKPLIITFDDGLRGVLTEAEPVLWDCGFRAIVYLITDRLAETPENRLRYRHYECLIWPEILAMRKRGVFVFGSHSHTHSKNPAENARLALAGRKRLRKRLGEPCADFCYPFGQHPDFLVDAVREAGFETAVTSRDRTAVFSRQLDLLRLPRVSVYGGRREADAQDPLSAMPGLTRSGEAL